MSIGNQMIAEAKDVDARGVESPESCPSCGNNEAKFWLEAPDRFHGGTRLFRLKRCPACSLVWLDEPPRPDEMGQYYGADYHRFISSAGENSPQRWKDRRKALSQHKSSGAILDLGCNSGAFLESLKGPDWNLYGVELSSETAKLAEARTGAQVFVGDIMDANFLPESFDVITCFDVLEHVYEPRKVIAKVKEWLKPGGIFYVLVPNIDSGEARAFRSYWYGLELPRHISHFSPASLKSVAVSAGLEVVSLQACPNSAFEPSARYVFNDLLARIGISRAPMARTNEPSLTWKVVRKMYRVSLVRVLYAMTSLGGEGESIHAIFKKA